MKFPIVVIGVVLIFIGILCNEWLLVRLFSPDGAFLHSTKIVIRIFNLTMLCAGMVFIKFKRYLAGLDYKKYILFFSSLFVAGLLLETGSYVTLRCRVKYHNFDNRFDKPERVLRIFNADSDILSFGIKKNFTQRFCGKEFQTVIKTNNIGLREEADYNGQKIDIAFVGDSFIFGYGVNHGERVSDILRRYFPDKYVVSLSYLNGWAPHQYYLFLKKNPQFIPGTLIMGFFPKNDLNGDITETDFVFGKDGDLVSAKSSQRHVNKEGAFLKKRAINGKLYDLLESFNTGRLLLIVCGLRTGAYKKDIKSEHLDPFYRGELSETNLLGLGYIRKLKEYLKERRCRLIVFIIPEAFMVGNYPERCPFVEGLAVELKAKRYPQRSIAGWFKGHDIEFIDPTEEFVSQEKNGVRLYFKWDGHWNKDGHRVAANLIFRYLAADKKI